jgi:hypothetical protein
MNEYKERCDKCHIKGDDGDMFARIFFKKIDNKWIYLCNKCWGKCI